MVKTYDAQPRTYVIVNFVTGKAVHYVHGTERYAEAQAIALATSFGRPLFYRVHTVAPKGARP